jgi:competence transcription factor ComK
MTDTIVENQKKKLFLLSFKDWFLSKSSDSQQQITWMMRDWMNSHENLSSDHNLSTFINNYSNASDRHHFSWACLMNTHLNTNFDNTINKYLKILMDNYP